MGQFIEAFDLDPFATIEPVKAEAMIADAEASAILTAPCLATLNTTPAGETADALALRTAKLGAVKAVLRGAILRWNDAGSGAVQAQTVGPFGQTLDTRVQRRGMFWPSELDQLRAMCASSSSGVFNIDTLGADTIHMPWCNLMFGATYCSCGADIAGYPIYEL
jgi:hypothetical protein